MNKRAIAGVVIGATVALTLNSASAQMHSDHSNMHGGNMSSAPMDENACPGGGAHHAAKHGAGTPTLPGQDAFGTIKEIITILEADPATDWATVNIAALRAHLVDMNRLVMDTDVLRRNIGGGLEMVITGKGGALKAIHTMVPAHAPMIDGYSGWAVKAEVTDSGAKLTVTATDAQETAHIRALGFYGLMTSGSHHQMHHLGLARGENVHMQ